MVKRHTDEDYDVITEARFGIVRERVAECYQPGSQGRLFVHRCRYIVVHKCSLSNLAPGNPHPINDDMLDAPAMAGRFKNHGLGTGGKVPYHGITTVGAVNEQMLPLSVRGAHARAYNGESLAWTVIGEDRPASNEQLIELAEAVVLLVVYTNGAEIVGHSDLQGASGDPKKTCPRPTADIAQLKLMVRDRMPIGWRDWSDDRREKFVTDAGLVI